MHGKGNMTWTDGATFQGSFKMGDYDMGNYTTKKGKKQKVGQGANASLTIQNSRR